MGKTLDDYGKKRDFARTPEPRGRREPSRPGEPVFVVHRHEARRLHYDLRLEMDGVLRSWAVPKGFSYEPKDKHLAVRTEDHPMKYESFEGVIPKGEYGAGTMLIWDKGHYTGIGIGVGLAIGGGVGAALGAALDNPGIGTGIGIALGAAVDYRIVATNLTQCPLSAITVTEGLPATFEFQGSSPQAKMLPDGIQRLPFEHCSMGSLS